mgnify:FL=1|tara:strand:- start:39125 stop:39445 length:321 start_codon:yes stop_codon:yes gene_type:complete
MIKITDKAKEYLTNTAISKDKPYVRFSVKGGGCAGFKYEWEFADELVEDTIKFDLNEGKSLLIDKVAEMYILGCTIDYVEELGGSYLNVVNPNATSSCGCGESFGA